MCFMGSTLREEWKYKDPNESDRGILLANQIHGLCEQGLLISKDYDSKNLRPAAYTIRIGDDYIDSDGNRQNAEVARQLTDYKNELQKANERISNAEKDLDRLSRVSTQNLAPEVVPDTGKRKVVSH